MAWEGGRGIRKFERIGVTFLGKADRSGRGHGAGRGGGGGGRSGKLEEYE